MDYYIKLKRKSVSVFKDRWVWMMALRDARRNFPRLFLFIAALITGIAALVAIGSLNYSLQNDLNKNAKELLGADLVITGNKQFDPELLALVDSVKYPQAIELDMASMVRFSSTGQSRLVRVVALKGDFPFYGSIVTKPDDAYAFMKTGAGAMIDETLASQYVMSSEDSLRIGQKVFRMAGEVTRIPGGGGILSTFTPSVYISLDSLNQTGLVQYGSRINYKWYIKTSSEAETDELLEKLRPELRKYGNRFDTVEERKEDLGEGFLAVYRFFVLLAFMALILGSIGVASSVTLYAREKREEVAVLRCIGSSGWQAFNIYFIQTFFTGVLGSVIGVLAGVGIQYMLPIVFTDIIPVELELVVSFAAIVEGLLVGIVITVLFTLLPLVEIRFVSPLSVLRTDFKLPKRISKLRLFALIMIGVFPMLVASYQTQSLITGVIFFLALVLALICLALVAYSLMYITRKFFPTKASFVLKHALSNLFRPNNQSTILITTLGLGAFILATLSTVQSSLLNQVEFRDRSNQSNTVMFDIQPHQKDGVVKLLRLNDLPLKQLVPIITCRIAEIKGKSVSTLQEQRNDSIPNWAVTREYRVTYRDSLTASEVLTKGELHSFIASAKDSVFVTISEGMHENLKVGIGDSIVFDIQGVPLKTFISGIRKVEWQQDPPNFIFVFPSGVLELAPQIYVATTRIDDDEQANTFQTQLVSDFPNVSLIDLRLILSTVNQLFDKVALVIRFMAMFSIITGLIVLAGAVINSKYARMKEYVLLRTVGASSRQINAITLIEYAYLGFFASVTGIILSVGAGWILAKFFFRIEFSFSITDFTLLSISIVLLTMFIGWYNSRQVIRTPPLQVLRRENG
jgi:putative ABC transport system permease protein